MQAQVGYRKADKVVEAATVERSYLTYEEAAYYTNVSPVTLWRAVRDGRLKPAGPGKAIRFHKDELDRFMQSRGR
jgi:excisionase family DNA binding protein